MEWKRGHDATQGRRRHLRSSRGENTARVVQGVWGVGSRRMVPAFLKVQARPQSGVRAARALLSVILVLAVSLSMDCQQVDAAAEIRQMVINGNVIQLQVTLDKAETIATDREFSDVLVGNAQMADVVALTSRTLYVLGKKVGSTSITLLSPDKRVMGVVNVEVTFDIE